MNKVLDVVFNRRPDKVVLLNRVTEEEKIKREKGRTPLIEKALTDTIEVL
jgi:hypothetical protein